MFYLRLVIHGHWRNRREKLQPLIYHNKISLYTIHSCQILLRKIRAKIYYYHHPGTTVGTMPKTGRSEIITRLTINNKHVIAPHRTRTY